MTTDALLVAVVANGFRHVGECHRLDRKGLEVDCPDTLGVGEPVELRLRDPSAGRMRWRLRAQVEGFGTDGHARLRFLTVPASFDTLVAVAERRGIYTRLPGEDTPPPADTHEAPSPADSLPSGRVRPAASNEMRGLVLSFPTLEARIEALEQLAAGALFVETRSPPPMNAEILLRIEGDEGRIIYVEGRVVFHATGQSGPPGVGLAVDGLPPVVQAELRRLSTPVPLR